MTRAIEVEIDESGTVHPMDPATSIPQGRALLVLQTDPDIETALLSEAALAVDWLRPEEGEAWAYVQPVPSGFTIGANGLPILPSRGKILTPEMVKAFSKEDLG